MRGVPPAHQAPGGGRDAEALLAQGFDVHPTDGTPSMAAKAEERLVAKTFMATAAPNYSRGDDCTGMISLRHLDRMSEMLQEARDRQNHHRTASQIHRRTMRRTRQILA
jgi:hypothetical protein